MSNLKVGFAASVIAGLVVGQLASAQRAPTTPARPQQQPQQQQMPARQGMANAAVFQDIEKTLGFVPQFFRVIPDAQLPSFWQTMKEFEMASTALDGKTKELIGLAVSAQIPCEYCVLFHTEGARAQGATDQQIREAVGMASAIRMGSTLMNGLQVDKVQFKKDVQRLMKMEKKPTTAASR